ncbi:tRNA(fMet)-specific endonuclease VapC [Dyadobacter sp. SG02]|uniref:type II toxin-antitoxin system VapC family toxin n=1 Tax=Dyadobacter sp. SG02 TaxID=1855291 RepID=UPI0008AAA05E|nr:PIN domain-containing protein [Dyadobacter sp. SG02]SEJ10826.1 tRNA(fMet)-specific endonuclease VapC [Dyadobacter sp. SG02]
MTYLLDTNIIVAYLRMQPLWYLAEETFGFLDEENEVIIPSIVIGELRSLGIKNNWGARKRAKLEEIVKKFYPFTTLTKDVVERYAEIDAFSQGRLPGRRLDCSARNMGKNDLWIAAVASALNATLITTDSDFDHLNNRFLNVARFELK